MIPEQFALPLLDFINEADKIPNLVAAILYGSVVKGEVHKKSDIDILLLFDSKRNPEVGTEAKVAHNIASEISKTRKLERSFSFVMHNLNQIKDTDVDFLRNVLKEGITIWSKSNLRTLKKPQLYLEPKDIFSYSLKNLSARDKMAAHRALYGYRVEKSVKGKKYVNEAEGLVDKYGEKIGEGVFLIHIKLSDQIVKLFKRYGIKHKQLRIWI